jgi:hypothetical protein
LAATTVWREHSNDRLVADRSETAKALGIEVPTLLAIAGEVIQQVIGPMPAIGTKLQTRPR